MNTIGAISTYLLQNVRALTTERDQRVLGGKGGQDAALSFPWCFSLDAILAPGQEGDGRCISMSGHKRPQ